MKRHLLSLWLLAAASLPAAAHFIWIAPENAEATKARVVFNDDLDPDEAVAIDKIAATKLKLRDAAGKVVALEWQKGKHAFLLDLPGTGPATVGGTCIYGVSQRGQAKPFLLVYHPKFIRGEPVGAKAWDQLPLEIVPQDGGRFQVLFGGKPAAGCEVVVLPPNIADKETLTTDAQGTITIKSTAAGTYALRARHIDAQAGEHDGKKYEETRHYATLVFRASARQASLYPPLPEAVSSLGAAVCNGSLYVYGGHRGRTHEYSTETVSGALRRLDLTTGQGWQELPGGPGLQGLALVAHEGRIIRIGGMQPRNNAGEKSDNRSVTSVASYDPATRTWTALPDLPAGRSSHDAVVLGDRLFVVGGWKMNGGGTKPDWHDTALELNLTNPKAGWQSIKQPFRRRALTAAAYDNKVYVIAGLTEDAETELTVDIYDPAQRKWTTGPSIPGPLGNGFTPAACVAGGRLYLSGADGKVSRLTEKGNAWEEVGMLQRPRFVHRMAAAAPDRLVVVGGASRAGNVALVEVVEPDCCSKPAPAGSKQPMSLSSGQVHCPIMTAVPVNSDSPTVEYQGVKIQVCCTTCVRKFKADPLAYLDLARLPQLADLKILPRSLPQVYCPVYRDRIVSEKDPFVMYKGQKIHLFNQTAVRRWEAEPEKYADPALLPQLRAQGVTP